jgi:thioredoxin reductase (NADPH)
MRASEEDDERFYRDTERIAFPALSDEQLATLNSLGTRRKVRRGEIIYKAGQRDVPFNLVLSGEARGF